MRIYGALPGGVNGLGAMSVPQRAVARPLIETAREGGTMTRIHLAERDPQHHRWPSDGAMKQEPPLRLRILLSFYYYQDTDLDALFAKYFTPPYPEVFADSGAFSAMTQGASINLAKYAQWIQKYKHLFAVYANLDVIKNAEATWENQQRLEQEYGLSPLPVFHVCEPWEMLERYIERYSYIALGVAGTRSGVYMPWLIQCFKRAKDRAVYHGFGITTWQVLKSLPWYSVDSSSWGQGFRFGQIPLFDERTGSFIKCDLGSHKNCYKYASLIRSLGFDPADFADRTRNDRAKICAISALSYLKAEQWLRKRHGNIYIPTRPDVLGGPDAQNGEYPRGLAMVHEVVLQEDEPSVPKVHLVDSPHTPLRDTGFASKGIEDVSRCAVLRTYLADTSNGINYHDADAGLKMHLVTGADGNGTSLTKGGNTHIAALGQALDTGIKTYLADARGHSASEIAGANEGLHMYLTEVQQDLSDVRNDVPYIR